MFRNDATASPTEFVATLGTAQAYTRYWRQKVTYPNLGTIDTIISEHYNAANPTRATAMERSFMGLGWGRLVWQAMGIATPQPSDLATRCPDFGFNVPPYTNWRLNDCRENVTIIPASGQLTPAQLWHP